MISNTLVILALVIAVIWLVPIVCRKIHVPAIVGFILAGVCLGEHGLGVLCEHHTIDLLGRMGMLYIMLQAGIEIDINDFRQYRRSALVLGIYTFLFPFFLGLLTSFLFGFDSLTCVLLGAMYGSHTLMTYPIVSRYGVQSSRSVNMTVGATMLAISLSLLVLAVVKNRLAIADMSVTDGGSPITAVLLLLTQILTVAVVILVIFPRLAQWFFRRREDNISGFALVMLLMVLSALLTEWAGLDGILGAFICGVSLNRRVPNSSALMRRITFVGNTIFVPLFLIGVGMMIDMRVMLTGWGTWLVAGVMILTKLSGKWLAALAAQGSFSLSGLERQLIFGLTHATAAGTLAIVTIGYQIGAFDDTILHGAVVMILVLCTISSFVTEHAAKELALLEEARLESDRTEDRWLVLQVGSQQQDALRAIATASVLPEPEFVFVEDWSEASTTIEHSDKSVVVYHEKQPLSTVNRLLVAMPRYAEKEHDFISCFGQIRRLSSQIGAKVVFYCNEATQRPLQALCAREGKYLSATYRRLDDWEDLLLIAKQIEKDDMLVLLQARHATPSYNPLFCQVPHILQEFFADYNTLLLYPEQNTQGEGQDILLTDLPQPSAVWRVVSRAKAGLLRLWQRKQRS